MLLKRFSKKKTKKLVLKKTHSIFVEKNMEIFLSGNVPSSKNSRQSFTIDTKPYYTKSGKLRTTKSINIPSELVSKYKKHVHAEFIQNRPQWLAMKSQCEGVLNIEFTFIRDSKRAFDYINAAQIVQDLMKEYGWIEDDNNKIIKPFFGDSLVNPQSPGVIIKLLKSIQTDYV